MKGATSSVWSSVAFDWAVFLVDALACRRKPTTRILIASATRRQTEECELCERGLSTNHVGGGLRWSEGDNKSSGGGGGRKGERWTESCEQGPRPARIRRGRSYVSSNPKASPRRVLLRLTTRLLRPSDRASCSQATARG